MTRLAPGNYEHTDSRGRTWIVSKRSYAYKQQWVAQWGIIFVASINLKTLESLMEDAA